MSKPAVRRWRYRELLRTYFPLPALRMGILLLLDFGLEVFGKGLLFSFAFFFFSSNRAEKST